MYDNFDLDIAIFYTKNISQISFSI